jgi:integrase
VAEKEYPEGTHFNSWVIVHDKDERGLIPRIRRWVIYADGRKAFERYPINKYIHLRDNPKELGNFVIRLNGRDPNEKRVKLAVKFKHAFIDPELLTLYQEHLLTQIPSRKHALVEFTNLQRYFLNFFIGKMGIADPLLWHRQQNHWAKALLNKIDANDVHFKEEWRIFAPGEVRGEKTIRAIINGSNRFMQFLHQRRPDEVPPLRFNPINKASYKMLEARRRSEGRTVDRKFIKDEHWKIIQKKLPAELAPWAMLAYYYGLRRSEAMAVDHSCIKKDCLKITRQLINLPEQNKPEYGPLKSRRDRRVPHWFCEPSEAYRQVSLMKELMHPDTFSKRWAAFMVDLGFDYDIHDIRHTWTTKAIRLRDVVPRDVQLAAGHESIETTMGYLHDDRVFDEEVFVPDEVLPLRKTG